MTFDPPSTVFGLIARALKTRRIEGQQAFTVMSCDNLPHNGTATRRAVVGLAQLVEPALAQILFRDIFMITCLYQMVGRQKPYKI